MGDFTTTAPEFAREVMQGEDKITAIIMSGKQEVHLEISPDSEEDGVAGSGHTDFDLVMKTDGKWASVGGKMTVIPEYQFILTVHTTFRRETDIEMDSNYGRGTTPDDRSEHHTSLQFHESQHGFFAMDYVFRHLLPQPEVELKVGMDEKKFLHAWSKFDSKVRYYLNSWRSQNILNVDCVGVLPTRNEGKELYATCRKAHMHKPAKKKKPLALPPLK